MREWMSIARRPEVLQRSVKVSLLVGTILGALNYGDLILIGAMTIGAWFKMVLTYLVPFSVSTHASVTALRDRDGTAGPAPSA